MIDGVIFDKDGTLFDFRKSWGGWCRQLLDGLASNPAHARQIADAIGFDQSACDFAPDSPVIAATSQEISAAMLPYLSDFTQEKLVRHLNELAATAEMAEAVPLVPTLSALRARGLRIGLATNDAEAAARAHLAAHQIAGLFDYVAGFDSGHGAKPAAGMLLAFAAGQGLAPARVVMVGDSRHDLMAGRAAGMRTVAVLTGIAGAGELAPHADAVLENIGGLADWIAAQGA